MDLREPRLMRIFAAMINMGWTRHREGAWCPGILSRDGKRWKCARTDGEKQDAINTFLNRYPHFLVKGS